ncbi:MULTISPECIES: enoyl-CoA hydratase/isomerase family protein [Frankia]|uniref:Enoyl-CoA hydratase n=1 Tax=Frankia alni (strain DSM 45986 / CECT 9034 / ACN14a) TaxID=326424 RepID=Q0RMG4_FRAAA|nr:MULTISPECIES: enoyl-CoA hydratase/isomerase family protein [Frankia]CAJ61287.1 Putative enoyl-CoA hydratase [Frankia alni ACN14a]
MGDADQPAIMIAAEGDIRIITINRPAAHNAVDAELHARLATVWAEIAADPGARAAILTGVGADFCAGGDFAFMMQAVDPAGRWRVMEEGRRIIEEMLRFPLPLVAAVNGPAVGLGASIAVMCDLVVLADSAYLADPHVSVGLVAGDGGSATWPAHVSMLHAKEFLLLGDRIGSDRAVAMGLANRVAPAADLMTVARELAGRLAALPARAAQDTKRALNLVLEQNMAATRSYALVAERFSMGDDDHQAFLAAVRERRARRQASS